MGIQLLIIPRKELSTDRRRGLDGQAGNDVARLVGVEQLLAGVEINELGVLCGDHPGGTYNTWNGKKQQQLAWLASNTLSSFALLESVKHHRILSSYPHDE